MADIIFPGQTPAGKIGTTRLPQGLDLEIWKGDAFEFVVALTDDSVNKTPIDLTGYTPLAVMKASFNSPTTYTFQTFVQNTNQVRVYLPTSVSDTIPAGDYIWNLQVTAPNGDKRTFLAGDVTVYDDVD